MIVLAIIGILATIAANAFYWLQSKSKQAEASISLGAIGNSAEAYFAENDTYVTGFTGLGWEPNGTTRYKYWYNGVDDPQTPTSPEGGVLYTDPGSSASSSSFLAAAVGNIDRDTATDQWTYNELRVLTSLQNDVSTP